MFEKDAVIEIRYSTGVGYHILIKVYFGDMSSVEFPLYITESQANDAARLLKMKIKK